jgi:hypothetical protein
MTPSLRDLQLAFASGVIDDARDVLAHLRDGVFPAQRQFQIYRHNTFANLTDALATDYPVVRRLVGAEFFDYAADAFIRAHPPHSGNLHDFGSKFAGWLAQFPPAQTLPYLPDMARLEWARQEAYHAGDAAPLTIDALSAVPAERYGDVIFTLHPSVRRVTSEFPILRIWQANQSIACDETVHLSEGPHCVLVARRDLVIKMESLEPGDETLLEAFANGWTLSLSSDAASARHADFDLGASLRRYVQTGVLTVFSLAE